MPAIRRTKRPQMVAHSKRGNRKDPTLFAASQNEAPGMMLANAGRPMVITGFLYEFDLKARRDVRQYERQRVHFTRVCDTQGFADLAEMVSNGMVIYKFWS